jgi:hypothetical protein
VEQFGNEQYVSGITDNEDFKAYRNESAENILADGSIYAITGFVQLVQSGIASDKSIKMPARPGSQNKGIQSSIKECLPSMEA